MRYLITLNASQPTEPPPPELMDAIMKLGEEATKAGALLDTAGLAPSAMGARVELSGGSINVVDGPFAEAKELVSYTLYEVQSKEEAVEWATRFIRLHQELWPIWEGEARIHKVFGPEDFAPPA